MSTFYLNKFSGIFYGCWSSGEYYIAGLGGEIDIIAISAAVLGCQQAKHEYSITVICQPSIILPLNSYYF